jgi:hypothetical protein
MANTDWELIEISMLKDIPIGTHYRLEYPTTTFEFIKTEGQPHPVFLSDDLKIYVRTP